MAEERKKKFRTKAKSSQSISSEINTQLDNILISSVKETVNGEIKLSIKKVDGKITKNELTFTGKINEEQKNDAKIINGAALKALDGVNEGYYKVRFSAEIEKI